jgi:lysophospholipase L1-like esterase
MTEHRVNSAVALGLCAAAIWIVAAIDTTRAQAPNQDRARPPTWVTAWGTSQQTLGEARVTNATVRMIARVTVPGTGLRIRLDNTFGDQPLAIGRAMVGLRIQGAALAAGSNRPLTFSGMPSTTVAAGGSVWSDPVALAVVAQQDVAVSLHVPGASVRPSQHTNAVVTSYRSADGSGDVTSDEGRAPFTMTTTSLWWLKAIDVETTAPAGAIVAFGDSITDGTCTTLDAHDRWENVLSVRLGLAGDGSSQGSRTRLTSVVNEGIGGNTVTRDGLTPPPDSPPGLERLERDVLSHHGVTDVIVFMGTNDIRRGAGTSPLVAGLTEIVRRLKAAGMRTIGVTIIPRHNVAATAANSGWNDAKTGIRREVNEWIRRRGSFDRVIDFDTVVRDPQHPDLMQAPFNCGDGIHPSPAGYYAMGKSIDLALFQPR